MANQELKQYISSELRKGYNQTILHQVLVKAGWSVDDIEMAFQELAGGQKRETSNAYYWLEILIGVSVAVLAAVTAYASYQYSIKTPSQTPAPTIHSTTHP